jgi:hypothetical protein
MGHWWDGLVQQVIFMVSSRCSPLFYVAGSPSVSPPCQEAARGSCQNAGTMLFGSSGHQNRKPSTLPYFIRCFVTATQNKTTLCLYGLDCGRAWVDSAQLSDLSVAHLVAPCGL